LDDRREFAGDARCGGDRRGASVGVGIALGVEHMVAIDALHDGTRVLHDPMTFTGT
jgi:hypothetical protein